MRYVDHCDFCRGTGDTFSQPDPDGPAMITRCESCYRKSLASLRRDVTPEEHEARLKRSMDLAVAAVRKFDKRKTG